jgi:hypothetical protein
MTHEDIATARGLKLYRLALSVVHLKGSMMPRGLLPIMRYNSGNGVSIYHMPRTGHLDIWCGNLKVLTIEVSGGVLRVARYKTGYWEDEIVEAAKLAA